jgi:topoisomerase-4 subunit A
MDYLPRIEMEIKSKKGNEIEYEVVPLADFIGVKSYRAKGKRLSAKDIRKVKLIEPMPYDPPFEEEMIEDVKEDEVAVVAETLTEKPKEEQTSTKDTEEPADDVLKKDNEESQMELDF